MPQVINSNVTAMSARRSLDRSQAALGVSLQRLSSGLRINSARDDAAGLAISERMNAQIRGLSQSRRNINDAVSLVQTSEAALSEMTNIFQRSRELAVQAANATNSAEDRSALQQELTQLVAEVDRISTTAQFNGVKLFDGGSREVTYASDASSSTLTRKQQELIDHLQKSWLQQGESMISQYFGIQGDGANLSISFVEGQGFLASVGMSGFDANGKGLNLTLNIDIDDFMPSEWPNGGDGFVSNDRVVLHELTHAVMARSVNMEDMPLWFIEGTAEFMHGADARLNTDLAAMSGGTNAAKVASLMNGYLTNDGTSQQYSAGYAAVRYLHSSIIAAGGQGISEVFDFLQANAGSTLDDAIVAMKTAHGSLAYGNQAQLQGLFDAGEAGNNYIVNLMTNGSLTNADTGAVGGADADGGTRDTTANGVVPDTSNPTSNPLANFTETFPTGTPDKIQLAATGTLAFQVGANVGETITVNRVAINAGNLGIETANLTEDAEHAILQFDRALAVVNNERARLGAMQNRLDSASAALDNGIENLSASRSRIVDSDYAHETATLLRQQILQQAGTSILAQANQLPQMVLSLLQ
jgi:flagellin